MIYRQALIRLGLLAASRQIMADGMSVRWVATCAGDRGCHRGARGPGDYNLSRHLGHAQENASGCGHSPPGGPVSEF